MRDFLIELAAQERRIGQVSEQLGPIVVGMVQQNMNGPFRPNSTLTKSLKNGGSKPLFDTGDTRASISFIANQNSLVVGTNKPHAPLINNGGIITPKNAARLAIPVTRQVKLRTTAWGVRKTLKWLEGIGWKIFFRPASIMGRAPPGAKAFGKRIKAEKNKDPIKQDGEYTEGSKGVFYVLYFRAKKVKVPKREFMLLHPPQVELLIDTAKELMRLET